MLVSQSVFDAASPQAEHIRSLTYGFIGAALAILLLVTGLTIYIILKYRAKDETKEPRQTAGNRKLEIGMVGIPFLLVAGFFFWSINTMNSVLPGRGVQKPDVVITGHQWWWQAVYPGTLTVTANEIHLPVGRRLLLQLNSADVIHDWWVPALGGKMDMIPGINNYLWVTIDKPRIYEGTCSEFCGQQHAWMRIRVVAQSANDYHAWLADNTKAAVSPVDSLAQTGKAMFAKASCSSCHRISGTAAAGTEGPDLSHFAGRQTMLAGMMDNTPANINKWLTDPQKIKPGANMPRFIFGVDSIRAITAYLKQLK